MICFVRAGPPAGLGRVVTERPSDVVCLPWLLLSTSTNAFLGKTLLHPKPSATQKQKHHTSFQHQLPSSNSHSVAPLHAPAPLYLAVYPAGHVPSLRGSHTSPIAPSRPVFRALAWLSSWRCYPSHRRIHRQASGCVTWPTVVVAAAAAAIAASRKPDYNEGHGLSCRATPHT